MRFEDSSPRRCPTYVVEGPIDTPTGNRPEVRTVWIIEQDQSEPGSRLVTAYPLSSSDR
ncbi:DUF6883 domain-containing protein [Salinibacter ruber]|uniref:DUF6883 domain-containing protein n=1 Tax=Salinibacter ruber TaxID=146919 RepID=UPI003C6E679B